MNKKSLIHLVNKVFNKKLKFEQNLFETENFDSLKFFELISIIEKKIKKKIPNKLINQKNFENTNAIFRIIKKVIKKN